MERRDERSLPPRADEPEPTPAQLQRQLREVMDELHVLRAAVTSLSAAVTVRALTRRREELPNTSQRPVPFASAAPAACSHKPSTQSLAGHGASEPVRPLVGHQHIWGRCAACGSSAFAPHSRPHSRRCKALHQPWPG